LMEKRLTDFLRSSPEEPFFLFAYVWDIHYDYIPPPPFDTLFVEPDMIPFDVTVFRANQEIRADMDPAKLRYLVSQYDGEIRATDDMLARLFEEIRSAGLWEKTAIVIVADHGEEFFDHGQKGHKHNLHVESVRVPLFVKPAGGGEGRVDGRLASLIDLLPTMIDLCGLPGQEALPGLSLLAPVPDGGGERFFELVRYSRRRNKGEDPLQELDFHSWGVRSGEYKYMRLSQVEQEHPYFQGVPGGKGERLYHVSQDPREEQDVSQALPEMTKRLGERAARWREEMKLVAKQYGGGEEAELTAEEEGRLRALGYVE